MTMEIKILEIRDRGTFIPALCVNINPTDDVQRYYARRLGYPCDGHPNIILTHLTGGYWATNDPYGWYGHGVRTFPVAHKYIIDHWNDLHNGDVVDVELILGETTVKKTSERFEQP